MAEEKKGKVLRNPRIAEYGKNTQFKAGGVNDPSKIGKVKGQKNSSTIMQEAFDVVLKNVESGKLGDVRFGNEFETMVKEIRKNLTTGDESKVSPKTLIYIKLFILAFQYKQVRNNLGESIDGEYEPDSHINLKAIDTLLKDMPKDDEEDSAGMLAKILGALT